jgi:hypothetical protein
MPHQHLCQLRMSRIFHDGQATAIAGFEQGKEARRQGGTKSGRRK